MMLVFFLLSRHRQRRIPPFQPFIPFPVLHLSRSALLVTTWSPKAKKGYGLKP
jgi:hypothetical protein